jgi:hypothetical protein
MVRVPQCCFLLSFNNKRPYFRAQLEKLMPEYRRGVVPIHVRRSQLFLSSYDALKDMSPEKMRGRLQVHFAGEEGVDAGGVTREWYRYVCVGQEMAVTALYSPLPLLPPPPPALPSISLSLAHHPALTGPLYLAPVWMCLGPQLPCPGDLQARLRTVHTVCGLASFPAQPPEHDCHGTLAVFQVRGANHWCVTSCHHCLSPFIRHAHACQPPLVPMVFVRFFFFFFSVPFSCAYFASFIWGCSSCTCWQCAGKAILDEQALDAHFTRSFYKHILGVPVTYHVCGA